MQPVSQSTISKRAPVDRATYTLAEFAALLGVSYTQGVTFGEPAFYAYMYPEPPGLEDALVRPGGAAYQASLGMFILPYEDARRSSSPQGAILDFFQSSYEAAATLARWDRTALEPDGPIV